MNFNYEISPPGWRKGMMIKHIGLPLYAGNRLITPFKFVWWWPGNWFWILVKLPALIMVLFKHFVLGKRL